MSRRHLSENEIQEYVEGRPAEISSSAHEHLRGCENCQKQVEEYRLLFSGLAQEPDFQLSSGFAPAVVARIQLEASEAERDWNLLSILLGCLAVLGLVGTVGYFLGFGVHIQRLLQLGKLVSGQATSAVNQFFADLHMDVSLFAVALLVLILVSAVDHFVLQGKGHRPKAI